MLISNFTKFLSFLKQQIGFSSHFTSLFSVMRHNSFFNWILETSNRRSLSKYKYGRISCEQFKVCTLMSSFCPNHIEIQVKKYRSVISHNEKFKEKLTFGFKYDMRNLVNFHPNQRSKISLLWAPIVESI